MKKQINGLLAINILLIFLTLGLIVSFVNLKRYNDDIECQRDIYKNRSEHWTQRAIDDEAVIEDLQQQIAAAQSNTNSNVEPTTENFTYAGEFFCTAYCTEKYKHICGEGHGITASGAPVTADVTVAVDTSIFDYGTVLYIEDVGYRTVQDKGGAIKGNRLDIAVDTHANALKWNGYGNHKVWIVSAPEGD